MKPKTWDEQPNKKQTGWNELEPKTNKSSDGFKLPKPTNTVFSKDQVKQAVKKASDMKLKQAKNDEKIQNVKKHIDAILNTTTKTDYSKPSTVPFSYTTATDYKKPKALLEKT